MEKLNEFLQIIVKIEKLLILSEDKKLQKSLLEILDEYIRIRNESIKDDVQELQ